MNYDCVRTRFAPSPTGYMHVGNLRTALYGYLTARSTGGKMILRIEDTDQERFVEGALDIIYNTLKDTGLTWDEGPDIGGPYGPYVQSERMSIYKEYALKLIESGHAYYCFCDKGRLEELRVLQKASGQAPKYDKHCLHLSKEEIQAKLDAGIPYVIRQNIPTTGTTTFHDEIFGDITVENNTLDDQVLIKTDGMPTYNFANVVDDHLMEITHVIRGNEYLSSAPKYNLLYEAFGWEIPKYIHTPPVMKDATHKLSKRNGDASYQDLIEKGYLKEAILNYILLLGWSPKGDQEIFTREELIKFFDGTSLNPAAAAFDPAKLEWINAHFMREMPLDELARLVRPFVEKAGLPADVADDKLAALCHMFRERAGDLKALAESFRPLLISADELAYDEKACAKNLTDASKAHLNAVADLFAACDPFDAPGLEAALHGYIEDNGLKFKDVAPALRTALMGFMGGPHLPEIMAFLGKDTSLARIRRAADM